MREVRGELADEREDALALDEALDCGVGGEVEAPGDVGGGYMVVEERETGVLTGGFAGGGGGGGGGAEG